MSNNLGAVKKNPARFAQVLYWQFLKRG